MSPTKKTYLSRHTFLTVSLKTNSRTTTMSRLSGFQRQLLNNVLIKSGLKKQQLFASLLHLFWMSTGTKVLKVEL